MERAPLFEYLLRLGDNCLILGHLVSEWCGRAPALEEDLALANVALDLIGQARLWLGLAAEIEGKGRDADQLAYLRDVREYRNVLLVEQKNGDFGVTIVREFLFDAWHHLLLGALRRSSDTRIAEIAEKAIKEVTYHLERSGDWVIRLGDGTEGSRRRVQKAIDLLWPYTGELFEMDAVEEAMTRSGTGADLARLHEPWLAHVDTILREATLQSPQAGWMQRGGKRGIHSEHLGYLLAELQFLQRAYPGANW